MTGEKITTRTRARRKGEWDTKLQRVVVSDIKVLCRTMATSAAMKLITTTGSEAGRYGDRDHQQTQAGDRLRMNKAIVDVTPRPAPPQRQLANDWSACSQVAITSQPRSN